MWRCHGASWRSVSSLNGWSVLFMGEYFWGTQCSEVLHLEDFLCNIHSWGTVSMRDTLCQALPSKLLCRCDLCWKGRKAYPSTTGDGRGRSRSMRRLCAKCAQCSLSMSQSAFPRDLWRVHQIQRSVLRDLKAKTLTGLEGCTCLSLVLWELVVYLKLEAA